MNSDQAWKRNKPSPLDSEVRKRLMNWDGVTACWRALPEDVCVPSLSPRHACRAQHDAWHRQAPEAELLSRCTDKGGSSPAGLAEEGSAHQVGSHACSICRRSRKQLAGPEMLTQGGTELSAPTDFSMATS